MQVVKHIEVDYSFFIVVSVEIGNSSAELSLNKLNNVNVLMIKGTKKVI